MATVTRFVNTASAAGGDGTTNGTSGSDRAYGSLSEWDTEEQTDLVADTDVHVVNCVGTAADSTATIGGWTTGASNFITINGEVATQSAYDTSRYHIEHTCTGNYQQTLWAAETHIELYDLQMQVTNDTNAFAKGVRNTTASCDYHRLLVKGVMTGTAGSSSRGLEQDVADNGVIFACLVYDYNAGATGFFMNSSATDGTIYNCTAINCELGFEGSYNDTVGRNLLAQDCVNGFSTVGFWNSPSSHNCSDIASDAPGTSTQTGDIIFVEEAADDFRLNSVDIIALGNGFDLSGTFDYDLFDNAMPTNWPIGCLQEATVAVTVVNVFVDPDASGSGSGADFTNAYVSLTACEANEVAGTGNITDADLAANNEEMVINCRSSAGTADTAGRSEFVGWNTDIVRTIKIINNDDHQGRWNSSLYRNIITDTFDANIDFQSGAEYADVIGMQLQNDGAQTSGSKCIWMEPGNNVLSQFLIDSNICRTEWVGTPTGAVGLIECLSDVNVTIVNNVVFGNYSTGINIGFASTAITRELYNNTCDGDGTGLLGMNAVGNASTTRAFNNLCTNNVTDFAVVSTPTTGTNATSDATSPDGAIYESWVVTYVDAANGDFHIVVRTQEVGTDLSSDGDFAFTTDIDGDTRIRWDIGADEFVPHIISGGLSINFAEYPIEDPLSGAGIWELYFGAGGARIVDNSGTNMLLQDTGGESDAHMIGHSVATFGRKQYVEVNCITPTTDYSNVGSVYCNAVDGGNDYHIRVNTSWSALTFYKMTDGSNSPIGGTISATIVSGDRVGLLAEDSGGDTLLTFFHNPTTYNSEGFPTNGSITTRTDSSSPHTAGQVGVFCHSQNTSESSFTQTWYAAGGIDDDVPFGPVVIIKPWTTRPKFGPPRLQVKKGHPMTRGLVRAFLCNEGGGEIIREYVVGDHAVQDDGGYAWVQNQRGVTFNFKTGDAGVQDSFQFGGVTFTDSEKWSAAFGCNRIDNGSDFSGCILGDGVNNEDFIRLQRDGSSDRVTIVGSSGQFTNFGQAALLPQGYHDWVITANGGGTAAGTARVFYDDIVHLVSSTDRSLGIELSNIGNGRGTQGGSFRGHVWYIYIYDRQLNTDETIRLRRNPYQIFEPRRTYFGETPDLDLVTF